MQDARSGRDVSPDDPSRTDRPHSNGQPQTPLQLAQPEDSPTPAASLFWRTQDNDAINPPGLGAADLMRLVHDIAGPVRSLRDIPNWIAEDLAEASGSLPEESQRLIPLLSHAADNLDALFEGLSRYVRVMSPPKGNQSCTLNAAMALLSKTDVQMDVHGGGCDLPIHPLDLSAIIEAGLSNAIRFHPQGRPRVTLQAKRHAEGWSLEICDDGPGPPAKHTHELFKPMIRAKCGDRDAGPGFGLAIIAAIADRNTAQADLKRGEAGAVLCISGS